MSCFTLENTEKINFLEKCGEIIPALRLNVQPMFVFKCTLCLDVSLQWEEFALHIEVQHLEDLLKTVQISEDINSLKINKLVSGILPIEEKEEQNDNTFELQELGNDNDNSKDDEYSESMASMDDNDSDNEEMPAEETNPFETINCANVNDENFTNLLFFKHDADLVLWESSDHESDFYDDTFNPSMNLREDKELTNLLIDCLIRQRLLWDANNYLAANDKKRKDAYKIIANQIRDELHLQFKGQQIARLIRELRYNYWIELQHIKKAKDEGKSHEPIWYFNQLDFFDISLNKKQETLRNYKTSVLPLANLTDENHIKFFEIYKTFPCLWDTQSIDFRFKEKRELAINDMQEAVKNQLNLECTVAQLQKKIRLIRYACSQEKQLKIISKIEKKTYEPLSYFAPNLLFLEDHVSPCLCEICHKVLNGVDKYIKHKAEHDGTMPYVCSICNHGFKNLGNLNVHIRRHRRDYKFECSVCEKRFATTTDVKIHMRCHTGEKPYICDICGSSFPTVSVFSKHMLRHKDLKAFKCYICSKAFYENFMLKKHMKIHYNARDKVCNICKKTFNTSSQLIQHKEIHAQIKKYECKICAKKFAQYAGLSGHMKSHGTTIPELNAMFEDGKIEIEIDELGTSSINFLN